MSGGLGEMRANSPHTSVTLSRQRLAGELTGEPEQNALQIGSF
jgi:hypothetical protein